MRLSHPAQAVAGALQLSGSKSETNRLLILEALYGGVKVENPSEAADTELLQKALGRGEREIDIGHAGTAMRFLTAYFSIRQGRETLLTGSTRMKQRPIKILVDALRELGAEIRYVEREGYPPLLISGRELLGGRVRISAGVSSQYATALLLIAARLKRGLTLTLEGTITSMPYIGMTVHLLRQLGITVNWDRHTIRVFPGRKPSSKSIAIESDWSAASYYYAIAALAKRASLRLKTFIPYSIQGDSKLRDIYKGFGVHSNFEPPHLILQKEECALPPFVALDLVGTPDLAQTIAVSCFGLGGGCRLRGLHTLKIKETDRLLALQNELQKLGARLTVTSDSLHLDKSETIHTGVRIKTYGDHRMAMAFAPLALKVPIAIEAPEVVEKSYPRFWRDLQQLGFVVEAIRSEC